MSICVELTGSGLTLRSWLILRSGLTLPSWLTLRSGLTLHVRGLLERRSQSVAGIHAPQLSPQPSPLSPRLAFINKSRVR